MSTDVANIQGEKKRRGRPPGSPNKVNRDARKAITLFVEGNAVRLQSWLDQVADGVPKVDEEGESTGEYLIVPNPMRAFELFQSLLEYHVPKLARTVIEGDDKHPLTVQTVVRKVIDSAHP